MKTIKSQKVGVLTRPFASGGRSYLSVGAMLYLPLEPTTGMLMEASLWKMAGKELPDGMLDLGMPKSRGEWLVAGRACSPNAQPTAALRVRVKLGASREKVLRVVGDRYWDPVTGSPSNIAPFTEMPIDWAHAFGGPKEPRNPLGKGHKPVAVNGAELQWLPNVEAPDAPVRAPGDAPEPVGFMGYDLTWPQRHLTAGTYDDAWMKTLFPGPAADFDWTAYNAAPRDQWVDGFFQGDETYTLEGMHPTRPVIEGRLPGLRTRAFVTRRTAEGERFEEVAQRLETVLFVPHRERVVLIFRGTLEVLEDDASDVLHLVLGAERLDAPKDLEHYQRVLAKRLDPDRGGIESLRERDLLPPDSEVRPLDAAADEQDDTAMLLKTDGLLQQNMRRRQMREAERMKQHLRDAGINPETLPQEMFDAPEPEALDMENLPETVERRLDELQQKEVEIAEKRAKMEAEARVLYTNAGLDFDDLNARAKQETGGPPRRTTRMMVEELRVAAQDANAGEAVPEIEAMFADPRFVEGLDDTDRQRMEMYRQSAHLGEPARRLEGDAQRAARAAVEASPDRIFAGADLTGADLSGLDLRGADFTRALMESSSLAGCALDGARFDDAVLARCDLRGARAPKASFARANLGAAQMQGGDFSDGDFSSALLASADLTDAVMAGARLVEVNIHETKLTRCDLRRAHAPGLMLMELDLTGVRFEGADLSGATMYKVTGEKVSFGGATMVKASLVSCVLSEANFVSANLTNLRVVLESALCGALFIDANLEAATLRETALPDADFGRAKARGIDLSGCDLSRAKFYRAMLRESRFVRANLTDAVMISIDAMDAVFQGADLTRTDLTGANLHAVDLARVKPGVKSLSEALLTRARMHPQRRA